MKNLTNRFIYSISFSFCVLSGNAQEQNFNDQITVQQEIASFDRSSLIKNNKISEFDFELSKYLGLWYEQAHLPTFFQKNCDSSTASYSLNDDNSVKVLNICSKLDGTFTNIVGKATVDPKDSSGRSLIISFNFITDIVNLFKGVNYYVYSIDESYNYAIVGTPKKDMLWILTREKNINKETLESLLDSAKNLGFNTSEIIYDKR